MSVILYTTHCPQCNVLETKLKQKGIDYKVVDNIEELLAKGMRSVPQLEICKKQTLNFSEAVKWVAAQP